MAMRWQKWNLWKAGIIIVGVLILMILTWVSLSIAKASGRVSGLTTPAPITVQATPTEDATVTVLTKEKLVEDVTQGQHTFANWLWNDGAALISTLVIFIGGLIGFLRWLADQRKALAADGA